MYQRPFFSSIQHAARWSGARVHGMPSRQFLRSASHVQCSRLLHTTRVLGALKPYLLADIGEGITECQIMTWFVKPGDQVQQFDPICEVQSDKASVEITSRFDGTIRKLHYDTDEMAKVGSALLDIEVDDADAEPELVSEKEASSSTPSAEEEVPARKGGEEKGRQEGNVGTESNEPLPESAGETSEATSAPKNSGLVTPAVRHMLKDLNLDIADIRGTGKGQRVLKEDVQRHVAGLSGQATSGPAAPSPKSAAGDQVVPLTRIQSQMVQSMTRSLQIPHFLYTNIVNTTHISSLRKDFAKASLSSNDPKSEGAPITKLSALPFILKAVSQAATEYPIINSSLDTASQPGKPQLVLKAAHNIGIAIDTPNGLVVPVIRNVQNHSVLSLAAEIKRLGQSAREGKLSPGEMTGATLVISNIGSIGGHVVSPVILDPTVMILGVGKAQNVAVFEEDQQGNERIVKQEQVVLSWSADHRVLDGATVARCAERVASWLENTAMLGLYLK